MKRTLLLAFLLSAAVACASAGPSLIPVRAQALPALSVRGNQFVDENGNPVVLRGVSFSDPNRLEKAGHWNREYFAAAKAWNANVVRFPIHPSAWRARGEEAYLRLLDQGVQWAKELGMYVIMDWHSIGNLQTEQFQAPMYNTTRDETFRFWKTISQRYAGNLVVPFYELFNEPTNYSGKLGEISWERHKAMMEALIDSIRANNKAAIPLVAGFDWAYDLTPVRTRPIDRPSVAYVSHPYPQKRPAPWEPKWEQDWGFVADRYPIIATEFGFMSESGRGAHVPVIGDESYGEAIVDYFNKKGISWTAWVFDPMWSPQLIENWNFEPTPQGRFFRDKMMQLNPKR